VERSDGAYHGRDDQAEDHEPCADEGKERVCVNEPIDSPDDRKGKEVEDASANAGQGSRRRRRERDQGRSRDDRDKARRDGGGVGDASDHLRDESGGRHQQRDHTSGSEGGPQKPTHRKVGRALRSDHYRRSGLAPATVHKANQTLSKLLRGAVDAGLLAQTPCRRIELPRIEREEMRFLAPIEIARLADAIDARYRAMVLVEGSPRSTRSSRSVPRHVRQPSAAVGAVRRLGASVAPFHRLRTCRCAWHRLSPS
jgi:hypothetical protein